MLCYGGLKNTQCIATAPFSLAIPRCGRVERGVEHGHSADMDLMFSKDINKQLLKKAKCSFTCQWLLTPVLCFLCKNARKEDKSKVDTFLCILTMFP